MIYDRFGCPVIIKRRAVLDDVQRLEGRRPDRTDRTMVATGSYFVVADDDGVESLVHRTYLRADGGAHEVDGAIAALGDPTPAGGHP